jgi:hypothetical protein
MAEKNGVNKNVLSDTLIPKNTPVRVFINSKSLVITGSVSRDYSLLVFKSKEHTGAYLRIHHMFRVFFRLKKRVVKNLVEQCL